MYKIEWWAELGSLLGPVPENTWLSQNNFVAFQSPGMSHFFLSYYLPLDLEYFFFPLLHVVCHTVLRNHPVLVYLFFSLTHKPKTGNKKAHSYSSQLFTFIAIGEHILREVVAILRGDNYI